MNCFQSLFHITFLHTYTTKIYIHSFTPAISDSTFSLRLDQHTPSTTPRHRILFRADLAAPVHFIPCSFISASVYCFQLLQGLPLFLFSSGFQISGWRVVMPSGHLRVCLIQPHFLHRICSATGSCPPRSHKSLFPILPGHLILLMCLRQV
jgi:hypothetical protein